MTKDLVKAGDSVLQFLADQAAQDYEPGFLTFKIGHGTTAITAVGFGTTEEVTAVILAAELVRALWGTGTDRDVIEEWTGGAPLCASRGNFGSQGTLPKVLDDTAPTIVKEVLTPILDCEMRCAKCPWNQFGSATVGKGKMCKESRRLLLWSAETNASGILSVPPSSIKNWKNYRAGLPGKNFSSVLTRITLQPVKMGKIEWSTLQFAVAGSVTNEMVAPLGRVVTYKGQQMMEIEALLAEFSQLDLDVEVDYPRNGDSAKASDDF